MESNVFAALDSRVTWKIKQLGVERGHLQLQCPVVAAVDANVPDCNRIVTTLVPSFKEQRAENCYLTVNNCESN